MNFESTPRLYSRAACRVFDFVRVGAGKVFISPGEWGVFFFPPPDADADVACDVIVVRWDFCCLFEGELFFLMEK